MMINLGDTAYLPATYYEIDPQTRTIISTIKDTVIIIPYISQSYGTGKVTDYGVPTALMSVWANNVPNFNAMGTYARKLYSTTYSYAALTAYWPNYHPSTVTHIGVLNKNNGMFMTIPQTSGQNSDLFSSIDDFTNGNLPVSTVSGTPGKIFFFDDASGSGANRGRAYLLGYDSLDPEGYFNTFVYITLYGATSTTNTITINSVDLNQTSSHYRLFFGIPLPVDIDPYSPTTPESEEGGGDGEEDDEDDVDFTDPPSTSIGATGFLTIFCPTLGQLQSLGNYMWGSFDVDNWRKLFANPMDAILGLHIIPVPATITGNKAVKVAGIDTTIDMDYTTVRYIRRSMGTCDIPKKWGAYLDYNPYTKISIFLPYIGFKDIDVDDIMGETISLQYIVDILTGACVAELKCGNTVLYSWQGNCANEVPISGSDWRGAVSSALGIAATVATTIATGGATAPMVAGTIASVGANSLNLKPTINRSGSISGSAGFMGCQRPYIIRSIPNLVIPANQNKFAGYPSFITTTLDRLSGYNEISSIHLEGIPATGNELSEIETLLKGGVIF